MAITKQKKADILGKLGDIVAGAQAIVFVGFKGLPVSDTSAMRATLREQGVGYFVAKKTLMRRALAPQQLPGELPELPGEVAIAYGEDSIAPARSIREFEKKFRNQITILGGVFEGRYLNSAQMGEIASIPPLEILRGMFANVINSPIQRMAIVLSEVAKQKEVA